MAVFVGGHGARQIEPELRRFKVMPRVDLGCCCRCAAALFMNSCQSVNRFFNFKSSRYILKTITINRLSYCPSTDPIFPCSITAKKKIEKILVQFHSQFTYNITGNYGNTTGNGNRFGSMINLEAYIKDTVDTRR
jgi:hypothetical protein